MELRNENYPMMAAEFVRTARKMAKKSIRSLAADAGVSPSEIVRLEKGDGSGAQLSMCWAALRKLADST